MSNQLVWQERYNIGVDLIDKEHRKLFGIVNKLLTYNRQQDEKSQWVYQEGIKYFKEHALKHFTEEEAYMASIGYMGFDVHRRLHDNFRKKTLPALERELKKNNFSEEAVSHFLGVCTGWLIGHTMIEDRAIVEKTASKWARILPEEEQSAMRQTITYLLHRLFLLDAHVVSEYYGGEKFGKGIYYRLIYSTTQGNKWEILLVFEEKLIVRTLGSMMAVKSSTVNVMLMNAVRYMSQQFVEGVRENFPSVDLYEMKEENLLTYEQFQKKFEKQHLQFSMLFDTGEGYFAFCATTSQTQESGNGSSLKAENAMTEIRKYLKKGEESKKQKILVVDDSSTVRQAMKSLLDKDYEVALAQSGLSAIRCIMLNRPDMILLDYEMPGCDGSQVLEMIRSEEELADIPIIFLTGVTDKEKLRKLAMMKPTGFLLKTLQPAEMKKGIDNFFKKKTNGENKKDN